MKKRNYILVAGAVVMTLTLSIYINSINSNKKTTGTTSTQNTESVKEAGQTFNENEPPIENAAVEEVSGEEDIVVNSFMATEEVILFNLEDEEESDEFVVTEALQKEIDLLVSKYYDVSNGIEEVILKEEQEDNNPIMEEVNQKREIIEKYKKLKNIIKPGLEEGAYVVFASYDVKLSNIDTPVPGMSMLYVQRDESGDLRINQNVTDDKINEYLSKLMDEEDVKTMIEEVNRQLSDAISGNEELKELVEYMKTTSK